MPVELKTSIEGKFFVLNSKTEHERGKLLSQVILKYAHFKQSGARRLRAEPEFTIRISLEETAYFISTSSKSKMRKLSSGMITAPLCGSCMPLLP